MCVSLLLSDREIYTIGELRKWADPSSVPILYGPGDDNECLCAVDWESLGKSTGKTFVLANDGLSMVIGGDDGTGK